MPLLVIVALVLATVACGGGSSDTDTGDARVDPPQPSTIADAPAPSPTADEVDPATDWVLAASFSGALRDIVAWSDGFAAIHFPDGDGSAFETTRPELWYSENGIDWEAAPVTQGFEQVYALAGHDGDLFALTGDTSDLTTPQTLWHRSSEAPWEQVLSHELLEQVAIGAGRLIAYWPFPFYVHGVYDAASLEQVEFDGIPDLERPEQIPGTREVPDFPTGDVIGLDDGFLARVGWSNSAVGATERVTWLLHSPDGSTWTEHPADSTDDVDVGEGTAPTFDGLNLLTADGVAPGTPGTRLLMDRWDQLPSDAGEGASSSWVTDSGIDLQPTAPALIDQASATARGFFDVTEGAIRHSLDGISWERLDAPPTWSVLTDVDARTPAEATILDGDDGLIAVGVHETWDGFDLIELTTDIWVTAWNR